jgi:DNA primase
MTAADLRAEADSLKATTSLAAVIGETVSLTRAGRFMVAPCPFHGEKTPSFYVYDDHFHCYGCGEHGDLFDWLTRTRGMTFPEAVAHLGGARSRTRAAAPVPTLAHARADDVDARRNGELARQIWMQSVDPHGSPVETYLQHRGVRLPDAPVLRWHPRCPRTGGALSAMIGLMTDPETSEPRGVHRTFLLSDGTGKAPVDKPKMMLGGAGVIRLSADDDVTSRLGLAEGIETGLSVIQVAGWAPVWACGSAGGIAKFPVLLGIASLSVFADPDEAGMKAADEARDRWTAAGCEVRIISPRDGDWNDVARKVAA